MKKYFFNKIEKNTKTSFNDLIISFLLGGLKILILLVFNGLIMSIFMRFFYSSYELIISFVTLILMILILIYILTNRIPNQVEIFKNYLYTIRKINEMNEKNSVREKGKILRKFIFFYLIFNVIAYSVFLFKFHPKIENEEKDYTEFNRFHTQIYDYILIPDYEVLQRCSLCELTEDKNFYPFHNFNFKFGSGNYDNYSNYYYRYDTKGFIGVFGFYGHLEFIFYVVIPFLIFGLTIFYKKYIK